MVGIADKPWLLELVMFHQKSMPPRGEAFHLSSIDQETLTAKNAMAQIYFVFDVCIGFLQVVKHILLAVVQSMTINQFFSSLKWMKHICHSGKAQHGREFKQDEVKLKDGERSNRGACFGLAICRETNSDTP